MPILGRNPFNHHSSTHLNELNNHVSPNRSSNNNQYSNGHNHVAQPPLRKSSKSFLSFMSRKPSMESIRSDKSSDSLVNQDNHANHSMSSNVNSNSHTNNHIHENTVSPKPSHSMVELKRFFRSSKKLARTHGHNHNTTNTTSGSTSDIQNMGKQHNQHKTSDLHNHHPRSTTQLNLNSHFQMSKNENDQLATDHHGHTQSAIPPSSDSVLSLANTINIYHDDTILAQKYGRLGKTLGSGAGGSVKVLVRPSDGATFAVKEFRPRKPNESVKQYAKKCTAEFCIGSSLHHPNIVETIDIFSDSNQFKYFQVMEYLPIDFFGVVMTGQMSRGEINCCLKQLCEGVRYLHSMGLAHRDLKLDNCCMTEYGILKVIDFGSAVVFQYPFENKNTTHNAHGIVGSDPYLAPEVITSTKSYDPQAVDVWSIGIIFCCMMLKRFPWKAPKLSDDNFKLYSMVDDIERDYTQSAKHHEQLLSERRKHRDNMGHSFHMEKENNSSNQHITGNPSDHNETKTVEDIKQLPTPEDEECKKKAENENEMANIDNNDNDNEDHETKVSSRINDEINENKTKQAESHDNDKRTIHLQESGQDTKSLSSIRTATAPAQHNGHPQKKIIHGPYRLLRLLPHASRPILSSILEIDPNKRATLNDIFNDDWFNDLPACTMDSKNSVIRAHGHHHTIVKDDKTYKI